MYETNNLQSMHFKSYHQIVGIIVVAFILAQFTIGFLHHKKFKDTQHPTIYGKVHVWLGRIIIFLGVLNAFLYVTLVILGYVVVVLIISAVASRSRSTVVMALSSPDL